jgi:lipopolysaccharide/colanic/teichoic acid biosynthesis glycosyltransferase
MTSSQGFYVDGLKRGLDTLVAALIITVGLVPGLLFMLLVKLDSPGPAFFVQTRVGRLGRPFPMLKFRSMERDAEHKGSGVVVAKNDTRITRMGKLLRKTSLDELPQILNVLRGEMSIIGPRPGLPFQAEKYTDVQRRRLEVRPGITGWAQVNGRNSIPWDRRIELDVEYVNRVSLELDARILLRTFRTVFRPDDQIAARSYFGAAPKDQSADDACSEREERPGAVSTEETTARGHRG